MKRSSASILGILSIAGAVVTTSAFADDAAPASDAEATERVIDRDPTLLELPLLKRWRPGDPVPQGYHAGSHPRWELVIAGASVFASFYGLTVWWSAGIRERSGFIPVVGPFIAAANLPRSDNPIVTAIVMVATYVDVGLGVAQAIGVSLLVAGLVAPKTELVRDSTTPKLTPMMMGQGGYGMGLSGRF